MLQVVRSQRQNQLVPCFASLQETCRGHCWRLSLLHKSFPSDSSVYAALPWLLLRIVQFLDAAPRTVADYKLCSAQRQRSAYAARVTITLSQ